VGLYNALIGQDNGVKYPNSSSLKKTHFGRVVALSAGAA